MQPPGGGPDPAASRRESPRASGSGEAGSSRYAKLVRARRVWAIAAIHGDVARLGNLHDQIGRAWAPGDRLVYLGNYLGHGPSVRQTVDEMLAFRRAILGLEGSFVCDVAFLRGGQEEMWQKLLQLQFAVTPREVLQWMMDQGVGATLRAYGGDPQQGFAACREGPRAVTRWTSALRATVNAADGHNPLLVALRRAAFTDDGGLLLVNSGVDPARPLDAQRDAFWWGSGRRLFELAQPYAGFRRVVRGYDHRHAGFAEAPFATSIDGGCGFGGELLAVCFAPDGTRIAMLSS